MSDFIASDDIDNSRKRGLEADDYSMNKRGPHTHEVDMESSTAAIKLLSSPNACGPLIGRGGSIISQINKTTGCRVKVSSNNELYPGTTDRVVVLSGTAVSVFAAVQEVVTRILEAQVNLDKQQPNPSDDSKLTKYVNRVLIPSTAAGAVIGKGGSNVRQMAESSGCKMKVSDSSDPFGTKERIVTVMGPSPENVIKSIQLVMRQMLLDPVQGGYASLSHVYSQPSTTAGQAPFSYGGPPPSIPSYGAQSIYQPQQQQQQPPMQDNRASFPTDYGQLSMQQHYQQPAPVPLNQSAISALGVGLPTYTTDGTTITMTLGVPDSLVGGILGRGGSVVKDIMAQTGSLIKVSQRGELPDTKQRKIIVSGLQSQVQAAHMLLMQRIANVSTGPGTR